SVLLLIVTHGAYHKCSNLSATLIKSLAVGAVPDQDQNKSGDGASQVRKMRHIVSARYASEQVEANQGDHIPFSFDGNGNKRIEQFGIGKKITKSCHHTHDGARCANHRFIPPPEIFYGKVGERGPYAANNIVK